MLELNNMTLPLDAGAEDIRRLAAERLGVQSGDILSFRLLKRSVDARKKGRVHFIASLAVEVREEQRLKRLPRDTVPFRKKTAPPVPVLDAPPSVRPIVVGTGPAGLFAALTLARAGAMPLLLERGPDADARQQALDRFHATRVLDPEANVQFGEGGAGAFSDGKLTTNTHDPRSVAVLETFAACGAPEEILWQARPHVGTDRLPGVVKNLRAEICRLGGEVLFNTRLTDLKLRGGALYAAEAEQNGMTVTFPCESLILATGHSARDVFVMLEKLRVVLAPKPFSVGVRIEHPQALVSACQYGVAAGHPALGAADYSLSCHLPTGRSAYTFCMCPGGEVTAAASEPGHLVTNGASRYARAAENANAALLVGVEPADCGSGLLAGLEFQRHLERLAFAQGGGDYTAPAQLVGDFLRGVPSRRGGSVRPSYPLGVRWGSLTGCLPGFVTDTLAAAIPVLAGKLNCFALDDAVMTGVETRSSSPVRICRGEDLQAGLRGLFPCGEGAGYAGGITSAAVDGIRVAEAVLNGYRKE